jgi:phosphatidylinositol glycan class K
MASRYHELLFMIDTCQANTMYSKLYSPNIIATGSSEISQNSYSHHADNDVGVAVIDRYTYYNLDFLETRVLDPASKLTLGELFDSYDESKIHSHPGVRWDLFPGGEEEGRKRLIMDFFGNVQGVEVDLEDQIHNDTAWKEDLLALGKKIHEAHERLEKDEPEKVKEEIRDERDAQNNTPLTHAGPAHRIRAAKVEADGNWYGWGKKAVGAWVLLGCAGAWALGSYLEGS